MKYNVFGIGNPIIDITALVDDEFLSENSVVKGAMNLVDAGRAKMLMSNIKDAKKCVAGSVANTIMALADFGLSVGYLGKVGKDEFGEYYKSELQKIGVKESLVFSNENTACSVILTTSDAERSMNTYLGASFSLGQEDIKDENIKDSEIIYIEGYLFDSESSREVALKAIEKSKEYKKVCALTLSDSLCVKRHKEDFSKLLNDGLIDILFANHDEIVAIYGNDWEIKSRNDCKNVVVTMGKKGAMAIVDNKNYQTLPKPVSKVVDTTGAGDLFASGYLYGVVSNKPPEQCLEFGAICAAEIISHYGTRPEITLKNLIK